MSQHPNIRDGRACGLGIFLERNAPGTQPACVHSPVHSPVQSRVQSPVQRKVDLP